MRMHRHIAALLVVAASTVAACAAPSDAASNESELIGDIASMTANPDGTFDVVCKDGRHEPSVSVARIQAGDVCNPVVDVTPAPATPWGEAQHEYEGGIYNVSSDGRYAFVNFKGVGFGKFDLTTYTMAEALPQGKPRATNGAWTLVTREIPVSGSSATGLTFDVHSMDGLPSGTFTRDPDPGEGSVTLAEAQFCDDGVSLEWREATGRRFRWVFSGASRAAAAPHSGTWCSIVEAKKRTFELNPGRTVLPRKDFRFEKGGVLQCTNGACVVVRTLPGGTEMALVSRTGAYVLYRVNGVTYRVGLQDGSAAAEELPFLPLEETYTERDGRVMVALKGKDRGLYDIESGQVTRMNVPDDFFAWYGLSELQMHALPNGVYGFYKDKCENGTIRRSEFLLVRPDGESLYQAPALENAFHCVDTWGNKPRSFWGPTRVGFARGNRHIL